jgi:hypothetical protein
MACNAFILADSGNGGHLAVKIGLSNDEGGKDLVKCCLEAMNLIFSDDKIKVDRHPLIFSPFNFLCRVPKGLNIMDNSCKFQV